MVEFKLVLSNAQTGKTVQKEIKDPDSKRLVGLKIGDKVNGDLFEMPGYEFEITGGSDYCGFPMRKDLPGVARKKVLLVKGVGLKDALQGIRKRRTICGNTIHQKISQINLKVLKEGKEALVGDQKEEKEEAKKPKK